MLTLFSARARLAALVLLVLGWSPLRAADAPAAAPPPVEAFYRHADFIQALLSPSGRQLAVTLQRQGRVGLGLIDLDGKNPPRMLVAYNDADIDEVAWVNDTHLVYDLIDKQAGSGDQRRAPGLFSVPVSGGQVRQLVRAQHIVISGETGLRREPLAPNHYLLAVPADGSTDVIVGQYSWGQDWAVKEVVPLRLDVTTGLTRSLGRGMPVGATDWLFDSQGEPRLASVRREGQTHLHWRGPGQTEWRLLASLPSYRMPWVPYAVDDEGRLFVTVSQGAAGTRVLKRLDLATARPEGQALVSTPGFDFSGALVQERTAGLASPVLGVRVETDAETTVWFDTRLKGLQAEADRLLPGRVNRLTCRRCQGDDPVVLVRSWSDREPGELYIYRPQEAVRAAGAPADAASAAAAGLGRSAALPGWQRLGRVRNDIDPRQMGTVDFHRVPTRDGQQMPLWLTLPAGAEQGPRQRRPAVLLVHGGPWVRGGHWRWDADAQFLASRGYVVIEPEFRGSTGYGARWFRAGVKQWGMAMQDDLADALQWAVSQGWVDKDKVCIAGASYGGYAALMGPIRHPGQYRCVVSWVGVTDLLLRFDQSTASDLSNEGRYYALPELMGDQVRDAEMLKANSPVNLAEKLTVPVLMAYGREDRRVQIAHGERMRDALKAVDRPPEWIVYPDEAHGWLKPENRFDFARRMEKFLAQHLK